MPESRAAVRYAKALLELSLEKGVLEEVHNDMQLFAQVVADNRGLELMLLSPIVPHHKKHSVLTSIFQQKVHPVSYSIIDIITRKNREEILFGIATEFHRLYNSYKNVQVAEVTTTYPLDEAQRSKMNALVEKTTGKKVELREKIDPNLLGGFVLKIGDRQIDESVKGKLQRIQKELINS